MNDYISKAKRWYENHNTRDRVFLIFISWFILYVIFNFLFFNAENNEKKTIKEEIKTAQGEIDIWQKQISNLNQVVNSQIYKEWLAQRTSLTELQKQHQFLKQSSPGKQWQDIIRIILQEQSNNILLEIKNLPQAFYRVGNESNSKINIFQQEFQVSILSSYFNTINYIERLEQVMPNIRWENLIYEVTEYPTAKVDMEFSIFYEKNS